MGCNARKPFLRAGLQTTKVPLLESILAKLATNRISIFSIAEQAGLGIHGQKSLKTGFLAHPGIENPILPMLS